MLKKQIKISKNKLSLIFLMTSSVLQVISSTASAWQQACRLPTSKSIATQECRYVISLYCTNGTSSTIFQYVKSPAPTSGENTNQNGVTCQQTYSSQCGPCGITQWPF